MPLRNIIWTEHAEMRVAERGLSRLEVEHALRNGHRTRQINKGEADWRVQGATREDGDRFIVIYDWPVKGGREAARVVSAWRLRPGLQAQRRGYPDS